MDTMIPTTRAQQYWYLVTLGRDALLRELAPLKLSEALTRALRRTWMNTLSEYSPRLLQGLGPPLRAVPTG